MRKQIHPHSHDATILHTNGATTWSFCLASGPRTSKWAARPGDANKGTLALTSTVLYEISDVDVFLGRRPGVSPANENAISRFKKRWKGSGLH